MEVKGNAKLCYFRLAFCQTCGAGNHVRQRTLAMTDCGVWLKLWHENLKNNGIGQQVRKGQNRSEQVRTSQNRWGTIVKLGRTKGHLVPLQWHLLKRPGSDCSLILCSSFSCKEKTFTWSTRVNEPMPSSLADHQTHVHLSAAIVSSAQDCKGSVSDVQPPGPRMLRVLAVLIHPNFCIVQILSRTIDLQRWRSVISQASKCQDNGLKSFQTLLGVLWFLSILQVAKGSWPNFITRYWQVLSKSSNISESHSPNIRVNPINGETFWGFCGAAWG